MTLCCRTHTLLFAIGLSGAVIWSSCKPVAAPHLPSASTQPVAAQPTARLAVPISEVVSQRAAAMHVAGTAVMCSVSSLSRAIHVLLRGCPFNYSVV